MRKVFFLGAAEVAIPPFLAAIKGAGPFYLTRLRPGWYSLSMMGKRLPDLAHSDMRFLLRCYPKIALREIRRVRAILAGNAS